MGGDPRAHRAPSCQKGTPPPPPTPPGALRGVSFGGVPALHPLARALGSVGAQRPEASSSQLPGHIIGLQGPSEEAEDTCVASRIRGDLVALRPRASSEIARPLLGPTGAQRNTGQVNRRWSGRVRVYVMPRQQASAHSCARTCAQRCPGTVRLVAGNGILFFPGRCRSNQPGIFHGSRDT